MRSPSYKRDRLMLTIAVSRARFPLPRRELGRGCQSSVSAFVLALSAFPRINIHLERASSFVTTQFQNIISPPANSCLLQNLFLLFYLFVTRLATRLVSYTMEFVRSSFKSSEDGSSFVISALTINVGTSGCRN